MALLVYKKALEALPGEETLALSARVESAIHATYFVCCHIEGCTFTVCRFLQPHQQMFIDLCIVQQSSYEIGTLKLKTVLMKYTKANLEQEEKLTLKG